MKKGSGPILFDWSIVRITQTSHPEHVGYFFTGIGYGHPRLRDFVQFLTTEVQEVSEDETWGRTKSRVYSLARQLSREEFTEGLAAEIKEMILKKYRCHVDIEWISVEEWRAVANVEQRAGRDDVQ